ENAPSWPRARICCTRSKSRGAPHGGKMGLAYAQPVGCDRETKLVIPAKAGIQARSVSWLAPGRRPSQLRRQVEIQIDPMRVVALDQVEFPLALPFLDLLFPADRRLDRVVRLEPDQSIDTIARCEAGHRLTLVLEHAPDEIGGHPHIKCSMGFACQQIDVEHLPSSGIVCAFRRPVRCHAGEGRYPRQIWVPACAGTT